jgi:hypothetical protein
MAFVFLRRPTVSDLGQQGPVIDFSEFDCIPGHACRISRRGVRRERA